MTNELIKYVNDDTKILCGRSNNILKALIWAVEVQEEMSVLKLLRLCHEVIDEFPVEYDDYTDGSV